MTNSRATLPIVLLRLDDPKTLKWFQTIADERYCARPLAARDRRCDDLVLAPCRKKGKAPYCCPKCKVVILNDGGDENDDDDDNDYEYPKRMEYCDLYKNDSGGTVRYQWAMDTVDPCLLKFTPQIGWAVTATYPSNVRAEAESKTLEEFNQMILNYL